MLRITYAFLLSASCHYHIQHEQYNGHCLYLLSTHFSGNSIHLFHLENCWSTLLRACGSELGEWVGTRFRPGQLIWCLPEACDLSWASGSLARTLTGTPEKKHFPSAEVLKLFECKLASHEPSLPLHGDPPFWEWTQLRGTSNWERRQISDDLGWAPGASQIYP